MSENGTRITLGGLHIYLLTRRNQYLQAQSKWEDEHPGENPWGSETYRLRERRKRLYEELADLLYRGEFPDDYVPDPEAVSEALR